MKDQYFADERDFLKYELLLDLAELTSPRRLLSILMLTPNDETKEGRKTSYACGLRRPELYAFLISHRTPDTRRVSALRGLMSEAGVDYLPYRDDDCFGEKKRTEYFSACVRIASDQPLIFFDPDVGLQAGTNAYMRRQGIDKYLMLAEASAIADAAPQQAVFVVYQHLQGDKRRVLADIERKCRDLCRAVRAREAAFATDRDAAFLVTSRLTDTFDAAARVVLSHERHGLRVGRLSA